MMIYLLKSAVLLTKNGDFTMVKQDRLEMTQPGIPNSGLAGGVHTNLSASWRMMTDQFQTDDMDGPLRLSKMLSSRYYYDITMIYWNI